MSSASDTTMAAPAYQSGQLANAFTADSREPPHAFLEPDHSHLTDDDPDDDMSLFQWWRTRPPEDFSGADVITLAQALARTAILGEPRWPQARQGIFAPAADLALPILPIVPLTPLIDLILSAVLLCALRGDPRAAFVLILALRTLGHKAGSPLPRAWRDAIVREAALCRSASARGHRS